MFMSGGLFARIKHNYSIGLIDFSGIVLIIFLLNTVIFLFSRLFIDPIDVKLFCVLCIVVIILYTYCVLYLFSFSRSIKLGDCFSLINFKGLICLDKNLIEFQGDRFVRELKNIRLRLFVTGVTLLLFSIIRSLITNTIWS